jgi:hypothetical protein
MFDVHDPLLDRLSEAFFGAIHAEVPNLVKVRASRDLLIDYTVWCLRNRLWEETEPVARRPDLRVITNNGAVRPNPRRMSSPLKNDEIREFEKRVSRVFDIDASAMMEWRAESPSPGSGRSNEEPHDLGHRLGIEATVTP